MTLTAEERAEIRRENGRKSRGPSTDEGKERSRRNALRHGLRAEVLPLPDDDPEAVRGRQEEWEDYYRPGSPAARHLVDRCVRATLMADRCDDYHHAALSLRIRRAEEDWENGRDDEVGRLRAMLADDPDAAVRLLRRSGHGCRWLIGRWEALGRSLEERGDWRPDEQAEALRLLGEHPERSPSGGVPEPRRVVAEALAELRPREERLREQFDEPDRAEAGRRALIGTGAGDGDGARGEPRLFLRYHAESRMSFHRAFKELTRVLKDDAARDVEPVRNDDAYDPEIVPERYAAAERLAEYDRIRARRRTIEIYMRKTAWPNGETRTLEEAYRAVGLLYPHEREADAAAAAASAENSPNEPETADAAADVSPNEPEMADVAADVSPNEPETGTGSTSDPISETSVVTSETMTPEALRDVLVRTIEGYPGFWDIVEGHLRAAGEPPRARWTSGGEGAATSG